MREIDGRWLYYMFLAGTRKVVANQERLNRLNVFPVKDGDTGANMAFTLSAVARSVRPERPYKQMLDRIAETALMNARGNSGIIFAQFLFGLSNETADPGQCLYRAVYGKRKERGSIHLPGSR